MHTHPAESLTGIASTAAVASVALSGGHGFSKASTATITLIAGQGVEGDAHAGTTVKHRSRVARDPTQPNLRQVHLLPMELIDSLRAQGFAVSPGDLGENITTQGLDILALPEGTVLRIGPTARIAVTGLRNPCNQIEKFQPGLLAAVLEKLPNGQLLRKAGVMATVQEGGTIKRGDAIIAELPVAPHRPLVCV